MPDLDQLLDTLVADVRATTRPPGAPAAIKRARRRRAAVAAAGAAAVATAAGGLLAGNLGGTGSSAPAGEPATSPSESPAPRETPEWPASTLVAFGRELDEILTQVPGWTVGVEPGATGGDYAFNGRCAGSWARDATAGSDGGAGAWSSIGHAGWPTAAQAAEATASLVENLATCDTTEWRTQPIGPPGAVLAFSETAVTWVQQTRTDVWVLQVTTDDGPPPVDVQLEVVGWIREYHVWQNDGPCPEHVCGG